MKSHIDAKIAHSQMLWPDLFRTAERDLGVTLGKALKPCGTDYFSGVQSKEDGECPCFKEDPLSYTRSDQMEMKCSLRASVSVSKWIPIMLCIHRQETSIQKEWIIDNYFLCFAPSYNSTTNIILNEFPFLWCFIFWLHALTSKFNSMKSQTAEENGSLIFPPIYHPLPSCSRSCGQFSDKWHIFKSRYPHEDDGPRPIVARFQFLFVMF